MSDLGSEPLTINLIRKGEDCVEIELLPQEFAMPLYECDECALLWAVYVDAEVARGKAEADLTRANFSRDEGTIRAARQLAKSALDRWRAADDGVRQHRRSHVMTADMPQHF